MTRPADLTVVVPTYQESENLAPLAAAAADALDSAGLRWEMLVVDDDSPDGTWRRAEELAEAGAPIRVLRRTEERGLASACIAGFAAAGGRAVAVMDADLSHPPDALPAMARAVLEDGAGVAIGSRYVPGGSTDPDWPWRRRAASVVAALPARVLTGVRDPLAGFFCLPGDRARAVAADLKPRGFKILLEILVRERPRPVVEVPIHFRERLHGHSKLGAGVMADYALQLLRLLPAALRSRPRTG